MLSKKQLEALRIAKTRRDRRPVPQLTAPAKLSISANREKRIMNDHTDVLHGIESTLVAAYRHGDDVDDALIAAAIRAAIRAEPVQEPRAQYLVDSLEGKRRTRPDVSDELWTDALRVVLNSMRRHSECQPGDTRYLGFVSPFLTLPK